MGDVEKKGISIRIPIGLYEHIKKLSAQKHLSPHAYMVQLLWTVTQWKGR